jgi:hypothetical protein
MVLSSESKQPLLNEPKQPLLKAPKQPLFKAPKRPFLKELKQRKQPHIQAKLALFWELELMSF